MQIPIALETWLSEGDDYEQYSSSGIWRQVGRSVLFNEAVSCQVCVSSMADKWNMNMEHL